NKENDWESIDGFCDQLKDEPEGPQLATRLLAHKIQSPQEWEALQALTVLETCMKNCGKRFHNEVGKFRFLNELIKVVSPKYLGARAPEPVKKKVLEMMYSWTVRLPDETKILDAYQMLKKQGEWSTCLRTQQVRNTLVDGFYQPTTHFTHPLEDTSCPNMLSRLLNSTHAEDLRAANKLIKEMVQEDQKRVEKVSKRVNAIQEVRESVSLLSQLLDGYSKESCSQSNQELIKDLYQRCEKMRPTLFRLASDTEDSDEALADILQANDSLTQVINLYRQLVGTFGVWDLTYRPSIPTDYEITGWCALCKSGSSSSALVDLMELNTSPNTTAASTEPSGLQSVGISLLDDELMSLGKFNSSGLCTLTVMLSATQLSSSGWGVVFLLAKTQHPQTQPGHNEARKHPQLSKFLNQELIFNVNRFENLDKIQVQSRVTLRDLQTQSSTNSRPAPPASSMPSGLAPAPGPLSSQAAQAEQPDTLLLSNLSLTAAERGSSPSAELYDNISLTDVSVPLESIKPSSLLPVTVFDKHSLRVLFTFARDCPPSRLDVLVVIISMLSSAPIPVTNIRFQAAVPKVMKVKLQPPSSTELPAFNPILPPAAITQVLLLANPHKEKVRLRYKITFNLGDKSHDESGDVDQFPPPNTWGNL
uniref:Golgi-associated, gamma adaptin ear containing, ARF binding protein 1 n=1 Tax=Echeneis naucrates TaxID=173247 RepID=A0A665VQK5_ECHNA